MSRLKFLLAGGGTSGHITPAIAIAQQIMNDHPDAEIRFYGTARGLESDIVPRSGFDFAPIRARGLPSKPSVEMARAVLDFAAGRRQCIRLLKTFSPHAVIGTGGYVCSPVVSAAAKLGIPVLLHEQNAFPGRSNRMMARKSKAVCISFEESRQFFPDGTHIVMTGNPVRSSFFQLDQKTARTKLGIKADAKIVLVMGGSLGARTLNEAVCGLVKDKDTEYRVVLAAGRQHAAAVSEASVGQSWLDVHDYLHDIDLYMASADLIVCRAGAMTCAELAALGRPSVLVPYPHAAGDHQTQNAMAMVRRGAALHVSDEAMNAQQLSALLNRILPDADTLDAMARAASSLAKPAAAGDICKVIYEVMR